MNLVAALIGGLWVARLKPAAPDASPLPSDPTRTQPVEAK